MKLLMKIITNYTFDILCFAFFMGIEFGLLMHNVAAGGVAWGMVIIIDHWIKMIMTTNQEHKGISFQIGSIPHDMPKRKAMES